MDHLPIAYVLMPPINPRYEELIDSGHLVSGNKS